jgi:hypothetical protein
MCFIRFNWIFNLDNVANSCQRQREHQWNKPSDAREVLAYYNREQYGSNPLFYGQYTEVLQFRQDNPYLDKNQLRKEL